MDYEKKYKNALEWARQVMNGETGFIRKEVEEVFPELKSEDERIRKALKEYFINSFQNNGVAAICGVHIKDVFAWLEKQGQVNESIISQHENKMCKENDDSLTSEDERIKEVLIALVEWSKSYAASGITANEAKRMIAWLEKQGEKPQGKTYIFEGKSVLEAINKEKVEPKFKAFDYENANIQQKDFAPKVEPKFHEGDFIVNDYCMGKVIVLTDDAYLLDTGQGIPFSCEHNAHLWTIEDAKDGDVLVASDKSLFIYDGSINENGSVGFHIALTEDMDIIVNSDDGCGWEEKDSCHLATKKQRDLLFSKMKEEGYEWDDEKLEPIKVPKTKEHEGTLKQLLDEQEKLYEAAKIVSEDKDTAIAFLKKMGIIDEYGALAEKYRSE